MIRIEFDVGAIDQIKNEIIKKTGWGIYSKPDCIRLSQIINNSGAGQISESTLYRLFFQNHKHKPYKHTFDIIGRFLGYSDSVELHQRLSAITELNQYLGLVKTDSIKESLVYYTIQHKCKQALLDFFDSLTEDKIKLTVALAVYHSLISNVNVKWFFDNFSDNKYIREYFFEKLHDPNFKIKHYEYGLLKYLEGTNLKNNAQDYVFAKSVLFRHYYVCHNLELAKAIGIELYGPETIRKVSSQNLHIFPLVRYKAYQLIFLKLQEKGESEIAILYLDLVAWCRQIAKRLNHQESRIVYHTISDTLLQINADQKTQNDFMHEFKELYKDGPSQLLNKNLSDALIYFNENGLERLNKTPGNT